MRNFLDVIETKYLSHLPYLLGAVAVFVCSAFLAASLLYIRASRPTTPPIAQTATVIVFETARCGDCDTFRLQIGRPHQGSDLAEKVPLRYFDASDGGSPKLHVLSGKVGKGPIAVVFDIYGREQARVSGVPETLEDFQRRLMPHVRRAERDLQFAMSHTVPGR